MIFGRSLTNQLDGTFPEWRDKFLSYKELKKKLKLIDSKQLGALRSNKRPRLDEKKELVDARISKEEIDFIEYLDAELEKFNGFFLEKEEEYIIRLNELQDRVSKAKESSEELVKIRKEIVEFHEEMVLLEKYSDFNYRGLAKILKKYDKRKGALIRMWRSY